VVTIIFLVLSVPAAANFIEFEIDSRDLGEQVRQHLLEISQSSDSFCPLEFTVPIPWGIGVNIVIVLDEIEFPCGDEGVYVRPAPGSVEELVVLGNGMAFLNKNPPQMVVPVRLKFKSKMCMLDPHCDIDHHFMELGFDVIFSLSCSYGKLRAEYVGTEFENDTLKPYIESFIPADFLTNVKLRAAMDTGAFKTLLGGMNVTGQGVTTNGSGTHLAVRVEYVNSGFAYGFFLYDWIHKWGNFFNAWSSQCITGEDWCSFMHETLFRAAMEKKISADVNKGNITLNSIRSTWEGMGIGGGRLNVFLSGNYDTGNPIIGCVEIKSTISLHFMVQNGKLVANGTVTIEEIDLKWYLKVLFPGIAQVVCKILAKRIGLPFSMTNCQSWSNGRKFKCEIPIALQWLDFKPNLAGPRGKLSLVRLRGKQDGLIFAGTYSLSLPVHKKRLSGYGYIGYGIYGDCSNLNCGYYGELVQEGGRGMLCWDQGGIEIVSSDPYDVYRLVNLNPQHIQLGDKIEIEFKPSEEFWDKPYPLRVLVRSTDGSATFEVSAPIKVSIPDAVQCEQALIRAKAQCYRAVSPFPGFFWQWNVDPPPYEWVIDDVYKSRFGLATDVEFPLSRNFSLFLAGGYNSYRSIRGDDLTILNASLNGKVYLNKGKVRIFANGGAGYYWFTPGSNGFGVNLGGGLQFMLTDRLLLETGYNFHNVFTPGKDTPFSILKTGIRIRL
jgi:hypothetical protein